MNEKNVGEFLKQLRLEKGLSQNQLAEKLNISRSVIAKFETGNRDPNYPNLVIYSEFFDISVTELLAGERFVKQDEKLDDIVVSVLKRNNKIKNIIKVLVVLLLTFIISMSTYIYVLQYTATKVYKIYTDDISNRITDGLLVKTKDHIYLTFTNNYDTNNVKSINLYYMKNNKKIYILKNTNLNTIYISDNVNSGEYINRKDLKYIINDSYIELVYKDDSVESIKMMYVFDYSNEKQSKINNNTKENVTDNITNKSEIYDIALEFMKMNNNTTKNTKYNGIDYTINVINTKLDIYYTKNKKNFIIAYKNSHNIEMIYLKENEKEFKNVYLYNITNDKCESDSCEKYINDIKLIKNLIISLNK